VVVVIDDNEHILRPIAIGGIPTNEQGSYAQIEYQLLHDVVICGIQNIQEINLTQKSVQ